MSKNLLSKIIAITLAVSLLLFAVPLTQAANEIDTGSASAVLLVETASNTMIFSENTDNKASLAGLSRLPAVLTICEAVDAGQLDLKATISVSSAAAAIPGPTAFVEANENVSAETLLKSAVIISAGDAIFALAETLSGSEEAFVSRMNQRLASMNLQLQYQNISDTQIKMSPAELAVLGMELSKSKTYMAYCGIYMDSITHEKGNKTELVNPNKLIKTYPGCTGLATGSSQEAGYCGIFLVKRAEMALMCVVMGARNSAERFSAAKRAFDYGFASCKTVTFAKQGAAWFEAIPVEGGSQSTADLIVKNSVVLLQKSGQTYETEKLEKPEKLSAPLVGGSVLYQINVTDADNNIVGTIELTVASDIARADIGDYLQKILLRWLHCTK